MRTPTQIKVSSFRSRVLWLLLALVLFVQLATVAALVIRTNQHAERQAGEDLTSGGKVLNALLNTRAERFEQAVTILATDYGFRDAVTHSDRDTISSALENSANRLDAQFAVLIDTDNSLVAAASHVVSARHRQDLQRFAWEAAGDSGIAYRALGNVPYLLVSAPVRAPDTVGTVIFGFAIDEALAEHLSALVGYQVGFLDTTAEQPIIVVRTRSELPKPDLALALAEHFEELDRPTVLEIASNPYMTWIAPLNGADGKLHLVLHKPLADALSPYAPARLAIFGLAALTMLLSLPIARLLANAASRPLEQLVAAARRIETGNYSESIAVDGPSEFRTVASTLNSMQQHIADREQRLLRDAITDALTELPNHEWAVQHLEARGLRSGVSAGALALVLVELKDFDRMRASLGHHLSDTVIREVARRLVGFRGPADHLVRNAPAQFLFIAPGIGAQAAHGLARTLLQSVRTSLICDDVPINLDACAGICVYPTHASDSTDLLRRAETALYDARDRIDSIAVYEAGRDERHRRQIAILGDLRRAADTNELRLFYQPKIDMQSHAICGLEALVRWTHPVHGAIPPSEFVMLAEKTGNVTLLTSWVLKAVWKQMREWQDMGFRPDISVNLSAADLLDRELTELILENIASPEAQPDRLIFEITESAIMRETAQVIAVMDRLRQRGVRFSIDDFGTGYSSLAQFKHLPVDEIKIDKSFVLELEPASEDAAIVRATIDLGHNFGVKVVAEGVENAAAWHTLLELGCDLAQGYLISPPVPVHEVIPIVSTLNERLLAADTATKQVRVLRMGTGT